MQYRERLSANRRGNTPEAKRLSPPAHLKAEALLSSGSCFVSHATKRFAHDLISTTAWRRDAPVAQYTGGALWHSGPKNTPLLRLHVVAFCGGRSKKNFRFINLAGYFCVSVLRRCISKKETQEPYGRILTFFVRSTRSGQGMVHDTQLSAAYRAIRSALIGVTRADNQQAQQSSVNAAICLLAVRSRSLPKRRSDLEARYTELACCQRLYLIGSDAVDFTIS